MDNLRRRGQFGADADEFRPKDSTQRWTWSTTKFPIKAPISTVGGKDCSAIAFSTSSQAASLQVNEPPLHRSKANVLLDLVEI